MTHLPPESDSPGGSSTAGLPTPSNPRYMSARRTCNRNRAGVAGRQTALEVECRWEGVLPTPLRFGVGGRKRDVALVEDRWVGADHAYAKVRTDEGDTYILRYDHRRCAWGVTLFRECGWTESKVHRARGRPLCREHPHRQFDPSE